MDANGYWDQRYTLPEGIEHHARQNETIARDLSREIMCRPDFKKAVGLKSAVEIGCGTGDLANLLQDRHYTAVSATDSSHFAIEIAHIRFPHLDLEQHDILTDPPCGAYDLAVASNVVEHFKNPRAVIDKMFEMAPKVLIVAPFNQPITDGYDAEGGAGHACTITMNTFSPYIVEQHFTFSTDGWVHSSAGETPLQLVVLLSEKP